MASTPLVAEDFERGAELLGALRRSGMPVDVVAWSYSDDDEDWRLLVATSLVDTEGRAAAYARIRDVLDEDPWMDPGVGRLVVVSPQDPAVEHFRRLASNSPTGEVVSRGVTGVVGGRSVDASYTYNNLAVRYEEDVLGALQRVAPKTAVLRRGRRIYSGGQAPDFVLDTGTGPVFVDAKASDRALGIADLRSLANATFAHVPLIVVGRGGFSNSAIESVPPNMYLVVWRSGEDDEALREAVTRSLLGPK